MTDNQTVSQRNNFVGNFFQFLDLYSKIFATYICSIHFLLFGMVILLDSFLEKIILAPLLSKVLFLVLGTLLFVISFIIHIDKIINNQLVKVFILLGNAFGFLFNAIYALVAIGAYFNYPFNFFGIEKCIIFFEGSDKINTVEIMYIFSSVVLLGISALLVIIYSLQLRDKIKKEGGGIKMILPVLVSIMVVFLGFIFVLFHASLIHFVIYSMTGSMLFIFGSNLFKKESHFLKL